MEISSLLMELGRMERYISMISKKSEVLLYLQLQMV